MTWFRCSGGSGEVHGATIVAITNRQDCVGRAATLSFDDEVVQTKSIASDLSILFDPVQTDGTYTIDTTNAEGDSVHATVTVSARDVLVAETKTVSIDMNVQLVNYTMLLDTTSGLLDECVDLTGGWSVQDDTKFYNDSTHIGMPSSYYTVSKEDSGLKYVTNPPLDSPSTVAAYWDSSRNTTDKIDVTAYSNLWFNFSGSFSYVSGNKSNVHPAAYCAILREERGGIQINSTTLIAAILNNLDPSLSNSIKNNDLSALSGMYYVCLGIRQGFCPQEKGSITLHNVFMTKADDWQTLMQKGNVSVASLSDFFASSVYIERLLASESAVKFMLKKCTGDFMASAIASQNFLNALDSSPYIEQIWDNEHWEKFLTMVGCVHDDDKYYLYNEGVECVNRTGGFITPSVATSGSSKYDYSESISQYSRNKKTDCLEITCAGTSTNATGIFSFCTANKIDFSNYTKLCVLVDWDINLSNSRKSNTWVSLDESKEQQLWASGYDYLGNLSQINGVDVATGSNQLRTFDLSGHSSNAYIHFVMYCVSTNTHTLKIRKAWLE